MDGHDKLKPFGFSIHAAIDGYSRKILWLKVLRSNKCPVAIANIYLCSVEDCDGCPKLSNGFGNRKWISCCYTVLFLARNDAHKYVPSPCNQRI